MRSPMWTHRDTLPRRLVFAFVLGVVGAVLFAPGSLAAAASTTIGSTPLPFTPTIRGNNGETIVSVTLPPGATPIRLTGRIESNYTEAGDIIVTAGSQIIATVPATEGGPIDALIPEDSIEDGVTSIGMKIRPVPTDDCRSDDGATATLVGALLTYRADLSPPTTIGEFFGPGVGTYVVALPADPADSVVVAGLNAVAALQHRIQRPATTQLVVGDAPPGGLATRVLNVVADDSASPGAGGTLTLDDSGVLTVSAAPSALVPTVLSLDQPGLSLLTVSELTNVAGTASWSPVVSTTSLADFGVGPISFTGVGTAAIPIAFGAPAFGAAVESLAIDLVGVSTPLPDGGAGRIDYLWNDVLVASQEMTAATDLDQSLVIEPEQMERDNVLTVQMTYYPPGGSCKLRPLPARFDIDTKVSTVTATFGVSLPPGFDRFPQAFGATVPVAFGPSGGADRLVEQAGNMVAGLAAMTPEQLTITVLPMAEALDAETPVLIVGANDAITMESGAPLVTGSVAVLRDADGQDRTAGQLVGPMAITQAFATESRDVIVLGPLPTDVTSSAGAVAGELASDLAVEVATGDVGWAALTGEVMVFGASRQLVNIPVPDPPEPGPSTATLLIVFGSVVTVIVVALIIWSVMRPKSPAPPIPGETTA